MITINLLCNKKAFLQTLSVDYNFPILFTKDVFALDNPVLQAILKKPSKILVIVDSGVFQATPHLSQKISNYFRANISLSTLVCDPYVIQGGEDCKKEFTSVKEIYGLVEKFALCRHSFIIAIGGGAILDMVGFAAATAHRGIRLLRMPTTTLAQNDAGVGVKNGINFLGRKNFVGTFAPPFAVVSDFHFLKTLPKREKRAGIAEAVKVALIKDKKFFDYLFQQRKNLAAFKMQVMEKMIVQCAKLHSEHIQQGKDPFEFGSSRPLDFGHWIAHKIEEVTLGDMRHGEAVAIGIALDCLYSEKMKLIQKKEREQILTLLSDLGFELYSPALKKIDILQALHQFQEHLGGQLTIPLLQGIGDRTEVHEMNESWIQDAILTLQKFTYLR